MKIVLGGGGSAEQEAPALSRFTRLLGPSARVLYLPIAAKDAAEHPDRYRTWIETALQPHKALDITMWPTLLGHAPADLERFDGLFIGGGNTFRLLHELRTAGFDEAVLRFSKEGKPVYGGSAGAIVLGRDISNAVHYDQNNVGLGNLEGLNLCAGVSVWCHYSAGQASLVESYVLKSGQRIVTIPETAGLQVEEGDYFALGEGTVHEWTIEGRKVIPQEHGTV